jgi:hypothetical protein
VIASCWVLPNSPVNRLDSPYLRFRLRLDSLISSSKAFPANGHGSQPPDDPQGAAGGWPSCGKALAMPPNGLELSRSAAAAWHLHCV